MAQQTSYLNNPAAALPGMVAPQEGEVIWTKIASGSVGIGLLCSPGSASLSVPAQTTASAAAGEPGTVIAYPSGHTDDPILDLYALGIPIFDPALMGTDQISTATDGTLTYGVYLDKVTVPLLRKGRIWVYSDSATTQFSPAYVYTTHETNSPLGLFSGGSGTGKSKFSRGTWAMTTTGAGVSLLEVW